VRNDASGRGWELGRVYTRLSDSLAVGRAEAVPAQLVVPCLGRPYGANWGPPPRHYIRAVPGTGTKRNVSCRASVVLFSAVPGPAHRVSAIWPTITTWTKHSRAACNQQVMRKPHIYAWLRSIERLDRSIRQ
jgi:hypothetical protein